MLEVEVEVDAGQLLDLVVGPLVGAGQAGQQEQQKRGAEHRLTERACYSGGLGLSLGELNVVGVRPPPDPTILQTIDGNK